MSLIPGQKDGPISFLSPKPGQDFYSLDRTFLGNFQETETWDFFQIPKVQSSVLAFFTLRSYLYYEKYNKKLTWKNLSPQWKSYLAKTNYLAQNPFVQIEGFIPSFVSEEKQIQSNWKYQMQWFHKETGNNSYFQCQYIGDKEKTILAADCLAESLNRLQKEYLVNRAFLRKEGTSYLYLQTDKRENPRIYVREDVALVSGDYLLMHFDLQKSSLF